MKIILNHTHMRAHIYIYIFYKISLRTKVIAFVNCPYTLDISVKLKYNFKTKLITIFNYTVIL